ncbi:hypothetical protein BDB00DRAFT_879773 [Zychaea mexicana]|uniref:uncharacterized protein n=1 Tax=Zychaea mexicana TaxID=64656 RepID=UPI0022FDED0D|nr:uncharacterized protein BDB00DRAFT_879773 [Zychaea mexicana]KAI9472944.1 hypothetical protein BDB00DRAFT_879773 [Zychaea mexicana]
MDSSDANVSSIPLTESSSSQSKIPAPPATEPANSVDQEQQPPLSEIATEELAANAVNNVAAVFVVRFDVIHGNTIEWQHPPESDLDGIEYQAICSGHHRVRSDTILFSKPPYFGVSIFRNVDNAEEGQRGACMRAVGVIVEPNASTGPNAKVWIHGHALNVLAKSFDFETDDNEYMCKHLHHYFEKHRLQHREDLASSSSLWDPSASDLKAFRPATLLYYNPTQSFTPVFDQLISVEPRPPLETVPRLDAFPFFVAQFGPQIFVLWKAALLKKRILFLTTPPLQRACGYVYNTFLLGALPKSFMFKSHRKLYPKYAVGVNDIADLYDFADGYVACTSDTIFESKTELYDLVVDLSNKDNDTRSWYAFAKGTPRIESTSKLPHHHNAADFHRFRSAIRQIFDTARGMGFAQDDDNLNDQLDNALESKANCRDAVSTAMFQVILWYYRPHQLQQQQQQQQKASAPSPSSSTSWQRIFAGNAAAASKHSRIKKGLQDNVPMDPEEQEALLLGNGEDLADEERDAMEINNNDVFDVVAARVSSESHQQQRRTATGGEQQQPVPDTRKWGVHEKLTAALVGFFHTLSYQILVALDNLLSMNENGDAPDDPIMLTAHDMIQLGLHPTDDALFLL